MQTTRTTLDEVVAPRTYHPVFGLGETKQFDAVRIRRTHSARMLRSLAQPARHGPTAWAGCVVTCDVVGMHEG